MRSKCVLVLLAFLFTASALALPRKSLMVEEPQVSVELKASHPLDAFQFISVGAVRATTDEVAVAFFSLQTTRGQSFDLTLEPVFPGLDMGAELYSVYLDRSADSSGIAILFGMEDEEQSNQFVYLFFTEPEVDSVYHTATYFDVLEGERVSFTPLLFEYALRDLEADQIDWLPLLLEGLQHFQRWRDAAAGDNPENPVRDQ